MASKPAEEAAADAQYDGVVAQARAITPVPGGIGPVTDVWVIRNTIAAARHAARPRRA